MAHIEKYTKVNAKALFKHIERTNKNYSNKNIDKERTKDNYSLMPIQTKANELFNKRLSEIDHSKRKDLKCLCGIVITIPKELKDVSKCFGKTDEVEKYFKACHSYIENDFGKDNLIYSQVHTDETTWHLHIGAIPTVWDKEKQKYKICAKEKLNKEYFQNFHKKLNDYVDKEMGYHVSILLNDGIDRNVAFETYKVNAKQIEQERQTKLLKNEIKELKKENENLKQETQELKKENNYLKIVYNQVKEQFKQVRENFNYFKERTKEAFNKLFNHNWENEQILKSTDKGLYNYIKKDNLSPKIEQKEQER